MNVFKRRDLEFNKKEKKEKKQKKRKRGERSSRTCSVLQGKNNFVGIWAGSGCVACAKSRIACAKSRSESM